jgi:hypothetical protein
MKKFLLYLFRWQLSTPILWLAVKNLGTGITATIIANLIGGAIFFWVDRFIFTSPKLEVWYYKDNGICHKCGKKDTLRRLVKTQNYDKTNDPKPTFLCQKCSDQKLQELNSRGIKTSQSI